MHLMSHLRYRNRCNRAMFRTAAIFALAGIAAGISSGSAADRLPTLVVPASQLTLHVAVPLPEAAQLEPAGAWQLVEVGNPRVKIPAQLVPAIAADGSAGAEHGRLVAAVGPSADAEGPRRFRLEPAKRASRGARRGFRLKDISDKSLKLSDGKAPVLVYNHGEITNENVPEKDHRRSRACYIHPVWGLSGEVLTDDFPRDH